MAEDIFGFWSRIPYGATIHPDDASVFDRTCTDFKLDCLPIAFVGPLRTAPVVLLFLSPGFSDLDITHAQTDEGRRWYAGQRDGTGPLPDRETNEPGWRWWTGTARQFDVAPADLDGKLAIFNLGAYHSRTFEDWHMLSALPSSRMAVS